MRRPGDAEPEPSGGRALERLREFREERAPQQPCPNSAESQKAEAVEAEETKREENNVQGDEQP